MSNYNRLGRYPICDIIEQKRYGCIGYGVLSSYKDGYSNTLLIKGFNDFTSMY